MSSSDISSTTRATNRETRLYVGHGTQLTAEIPSHWSPDPSLAYDYAGWDGFISSEPLATWEHSYDSLEAVSASVVETDRFAGGGEVESTTWRHMSVHIIRSILDPSSGPVSLVLAHPNPAEGGHNAYASVTVDASHFDKVVSTISFDTARVTPEAYLDTTIDVIETHSLWRNAVNWPKVREDAHAHINDDSANGPLSLAFPAIQHVLACLQNAGADAHHRLIGRRQESSTPAPAKTVEPVGSQLPNGIGYVSIPPGFVGDDDEAVRFISLLHAFFMNQKEQTTRGWIIDLRKNTGGNMYPMIAGLAPLLDPGPVIGFREVNGKETEIALTDACTFEANGEPMEWTSSFTTHRNPGSLAQPVAVLIGPRTISSGEATAITLAGRDRTRFFGGTTSGAATSPSTLDLFDGSLLDIATCWMVGPQGAIYPDGVFPDVVVNPSDVVEPIGDDPVVQAAIDWLEQQSGVAS